MKKYLLFILLPAFLFSNDDSESIMLGVTTGVNYISNETNYSIIDSDTCCGNFNDGQDIGFYTGLNFEYELLSNFLHIQSRALFDSRPATLNAETNDYIIYNPDLSEYENATVDNNFDATINYFTFGLNFLVQPISTLPVRLGIGYDISDASITNEFSQARSIVEPSGIMINGKNTEVVDEGEMNNLTSSQGLSLGLSARIQIDDRISLNPEFIYRHPINSIVSNSDWTSRIFRAGASIMVSLNSVSEKEDKVIYQIKEQPIIEKEEEIIVSKEEVAVDEKLINNLSVSDLLITETVVTQTYPILPYIFFNESDSNLGDKYKLKGTTNNFKVEDLEKNSLYIYYRMLDIIALRIKEYNSEINITGFTDGVELKDSTDRLNLAKSRAQEVKNYLTDKWGITSNLINISFREIPYSPTNNEYSEGLTENRRVKISSDDLRILKPIVHSEFQEYKVNKDNININLDIKNIDTIEDLTINISDDKNTIFNKSYFDNIRNEIKIELSDDLIKSLASSDHERLSLELMITKNNGRIESKKIDLDIDLDKSNYELGRLNLIVFDFDKSEISNENKSMINTFIVENIKENSTINVTGSTDYLGEKDYNKRLSTSRATNVANYIKNLVPDAQFNSVVGLGSENPQFDNSKPEGRFYCRTVFVEVKTPISE
ncbi:MAG: OmpA family protein [Chlorobiota bacterium]